MSEVTLSKGERLIRARIQHYNETKYWKYRNEVISCGGESRNPQMSAEITVYQKM